MRLSRWLWGNPPAAVPPRFPLAVYLLNMLFAMVLSGSAGVWAPIGVALAFGLLGVAVARGLSARRLTPRSVT